MIQHNLLLTYRTFRRFRGSFFINLVGLSTGMACTLLIYLWVNDELHFDKFHPGEGRLYQVMEHRQEGATVGTTHESSGMMAETLAGEFPEIEYAAAVAPPAWFGKFTLSAGERSVKATGQYVGPDYFSIFPYGLPAGKAGQVLRDKNAIVISRELALRLFNTPNAVGKTVEFQRQQSYLVSGVFEGTPANSSVQFDFALSFETFKDEAPWVLQWGNTGPGAYVMLREGVDVDGLNARLAGVHKRRDENSFRTVFLRPYSAGYLYGGYENGVQAGGRIAYVRLFAAIALFVLLIACINFTNLSTAQASRRTKEVGIKKAIGAGRGALVGQYLGESLLMAFLSLLTALLLVSLFLPEFNRITGKALVLDARPGLVAACLGITVLTGLLAGSYPALYLSGFHPMAVLKGKLHRSVGEVWARKGLVVFQFALSVVFIVSMLVVYGQIGFLQTKHLGYDKDHVVHIEIEGKVKKNTDAFVAAVKNIPGVVNAASGEPDMMGHNFSTANLEWPGKDEQELVFFECMRVNYGFIETLGFRLKDGRAFDRSRPADAAALVLNEAAVRHMGLRDPVGKTIRDGGREAPIIGVVEDFHFESLHQDVKPLYFRILPDNAEKIMVRLAAGRESETLRRLGQFYRTYNPGFVFDYQFLDAEYQAEYAAERRVSVLSGYFAGFAILISCLGLLGLAAFTAERRRKEIGVRKVLGSSTFGIVYLLSGDFTKLVGGAVLLALPVSFLLAKGWLAGFAYRVPLSPWYFLAAGGIAMLVALFTVGTQALRAARINPTHCLKEE